MRKLFLLILLSTCCLTLTAQRLTPQQARQRVNRPRLRLAHQSKALYAFDSPDGFVLTSTRSDQPALLGYSDGCTFEQAMNSPIFRQMVKRFEQHWNNEMRIFKPTGVKETVQPLITDNWNQYAPFNGFCPVVTTGEGDAAEEKTCVTGCVAHAMAQVMNYYNWPLHGTGSHTYLDSLGCKQTLTADFSAHTYDWDNILEDYDGGDYSQQQADAVARLLSDCGIAVNMRYGAEASAARSIYQPLALATYFDYDPGVQLHYRNFYPQAEWDSIMFTELSEGRPLIVSGWSLDLGHSFVCDGYDANGFFHCNFGNPQGDANGYYYFTWLTPDQPRWHDVDNPETGFNLLQALITGIRPRKPNQPGKERHLFAFAYMEVLEPDEEDETAVKEPCIVVHALSNIGWNRHHGRVGIALKTAGQPERTPVGTTTLVYTYQHDFLLEEIEDTCYTDTIPVSILVNRPQQQPATGSYRLVPVFEEDGMFVEARTMVGTPNFLYYTPDPTATNGVTVSEPENEWAQLSVSDVSFPDTIQVLQPPHFTLRVHNDGNEYSGRLYLALRTYSETPDEKPAQVRVFNELGISLLPGETQTLEFKMFALQGIAPGKYTLMILNDVDLFTSAINVLHNDLEHIITVIPSNYYTAIDDVHSSGIDNDIYYNMQGIRTTSPNRRGYWVVNGKKVLIR